MASTMAGGNSLAPQPDGSPGSYGAKQTPPTLAPSGGGAAPSSTGQSPLSSSPANLGNNTVHRIIKRRSAVACRSVFPTRGAPDMDREFRHPRMKGDKARKESSRPPRSQPSAGSGTSFASPAGGAITGIPADPWDMLPPLEQVVDAVNTFTRQYFQLGFIPRHTFIQQLREQPRSISLFLLLSLLSVSGRMTPSLVKAYGSADSTAELFMDRASTIALTELYQEPTLPRCQAFYLLSLAQQGSGYRNRSYVNLGIALRMAILMKLHREESYSLEDPTPTMVQNAESARRTLPWDVNSEYASIKKRLNDWENSLPAEHLWSRTLLREHKAKGVDLPSPNLVSNVTGSMTHYAPAPTSLPAPLVLPPPAPQGLQIGAGAGRTPTGFQTQVQNHQHHQQSTPHQDTANMVPNGGAMPGMGPSMGHSLAPVQLGESPTLPQLPPMPPSTQISPDNGMSNLMVQIYDSSHMSTAAEAEAAAVLVGGMAHHGVVGYGGNQLHQHQAHQQQQQQQHGDMYPAHQLTDQGHGMHVDLMAGSNMAMMETVVAYDPELAHPMVPDDGYQNELQAWAQGPGLQAGASWASSVYSF
ncbi:hypothetical protein SCUCBS95973_008531 [Sporothrix curviconia]|uniref:Xylanolytic transcriptional activator regulatory domain-containing protein n=1 Tax=Sporothrix curviconia TaxID=1260050 RepID=A0ABP0CNU0_9PEZI